MILNMIKLKLEILDDFIICESWNQTVADKKLIYELSLPIYLHLIALNK